MSWSRAWVIARTDLRQLRQSRDFWLPMMVIATLFFVVLPTILLFSLSAISEQALTQQLSQVVNVLPSTIKSAARSAVPGNQPQLEMAYSVAVFMFAPLAVIVPLTVSSAVGANTIIGERERGSGEFLAHSPATTREIYVGKMLAALIPGLVTAGIGFLCYSVVVNVTVGSQIGGWFFPTPAWWVLMGWVVPPFIALAVALILAISARVSSAAAAQQASSLITLPLIMLSYGIASGSLFSGLEAAWAIGAMAWAVALGALFVLASSLSRQRLLGLGSG